MNIVHNVTLEKNIAMGSQMQLNLNNFLKTWDEEYQEQAKEISLFNKKLTSNWTSEQRKHFIKIFYHSRGHFKDFLWHLGNFAPNAESKSMILENISEEFNDNNFSHEQLYLDFAIKEGINLFDEYLNKIHYSDNMRKFNELHLKWLHSHSNWNSKLAAFSAYERLDSTDYELLSNALFSSQEDEHEFFKIHREAKHFDKTYISLLSAWEKDRLLVEEAFDFIANSQLEMWRDLANETFSFYQGH
jgi:hypothetical protein